MPATAMAARLRCAIAGLTLESPQARALYESQVRNSAAAGSPSRMLASHSTRKSRHAAATAAVATAPACLRTLPPAERLRLGSHGGQHCLRARHAPIVRLLEDRDPARVGMREVEATAVRDD